MTTQKSVSAGVHHDPRAIQNDKTVHAAARATRLNDPERADVCMLRGMCLGFASWDFVRRTATIPAASFVASLDKLLNSEIPSQVVDIASADKQNAFGEPYVAYSSFAFGKVEQPWEGWRYAMGFKKKRLYAPLPDGLLAPSSELLHTTALNLFKTAEQLLAGVKRESHGFRFVLPSPGDVLVVGREYTPEQCRRDLKEGDDPVRDLYAELTLTYGAVKFYTKEEVDSGAAGEEHQRRFVDFKLNN